MPTEFFSIGWELLRACGHELGDTREVGAPPANMEKSVTEPARHPDATDDTTDWPRVRDGDHAAFRRVFERHVGAIHGFLLRRCGDLTLAEDLASEVFLQAWRQRSRVQLHDASLRPWLYGVASNLVRQHWRSRSRFGRALARLPVEVPDHGHDDLVARGLDDRARLRDLRCAIDQLPADQAEVWFMRVWEELEYQAIAVALNLPVGTVKSRLSRARSRLRELMPDDHHHEVVAGIRRPPIPRMASPAATTKDQR